MKEVEEIKTPTHPAKIFVAALAGISALIFLASGGQLPALFAIAGIILIIVLAQFMRIKYNRQFKKSNNSSMTAKPLAAILLATEAALSVGAIMIHMPAIPVLIVGFVLSLVTYRLVS